MSKDGNDRTMMIDVAKLRPKAPTPVGQRRPPPPPPAAQAPAAQAPDPRPRTWAPFKYGTLERVSKAHTRVVRNLEWLVPNVQSAGEASTSLAKRLGEMLDEQVSITTDHVEFVQPGKLRRYVGDPTFLAVLAPFPHKARGLLEVDLGLAHWAIDTLLGGTGEAVGLRALTDIEEGVMTFVVLESLKALTPSLDPALPRLRLETITPSLEQALSVMSEDEPLAVAQFKLLCGGHQGYVRLFIPEGVLAASAPAVDAPVRRQRYAKALELNADRLGNVRSSLRAEIGQVEISSGDLAQLRERDVVLVDGLSARPDRQEGGTAKLKLGLGRSGYLAADVAVDGGRYLATLKQVVLEQPALAAGVEGDAPEPAAPFQPPDEATNPGAENIMDEAQAQAADLLSDVPLQISVEIGRLPITAEEIVGLKVGHVFDLNRQVGEPLDLSVNGKIVARGELVEIEGNLGIRIVALAG